MTVYILYIIFARADVSLLYTLKAVSIMNNLNRREFLAIGASMLLVGGRVDAEMPRLELDDPTAQALGYVDNASTVDPDSYPTFQPNQRCANCALYTASSPKTGPCTAFPGKRVAAAGWCVAWAPKA